MSDVIIDLAGGVLSVTLARSEKKNALTDEMYRVLADAVERGETDPEVRVIVLRGEGDLFTAGNDIGEFAAQSDGSGTAPEHKQSRRLIRALCASTTPIVAAVQGKAVGIGTTMLLHCDVVLLAEGAQLITPFVNLALVPEAGSSLLLTDRLGHARAFRMFALGEPLSAEDAVAAGVATAVVAADDLSAEAARIATALAAKPAGSLRATKRLMRDRVRLESVVEEEFEVFDERLRSAEAAEAFAAFAEKRKPDFSQFA